MIFGDARAGDGNIRLEFKPPVRMLLFEIKKNLVNVAPGFAHRNRGRHSNIQEEIGSLGRAAGAPRMAAANAAEIHDSLLAAVSCLLLPGGAPFQDGVHQLIHAADGVHLFAPFAERGVDVDARAGNADPHGAKVFENDAHVGGLAEDAHIRKHAAVNEVMRAKTVAPIFFALVFAPLCLFDFASHRGDDDVALEPDACALERFDGVCITNKRALHVVDPQPVDDAILDHGVRFVTDASEKVLAAAVGSVHVAVEHQILPGTGTGPASNDVGAAFFDLLPGNV